MVEGTRYEQSVCGRGIGLKHERGHSDDAVERLVSILLLLARPFDRGHLIVYAVKIARIGRVDASAVLLHDKARH